MAEKTPDFVKRVRWIFPEAFYYTSATEKELAICETYDRLCLIFGTRLSDDGYIRLGQWKGKDLYWRGFMYKGYFGDKKPQETWVLNEASKKILGEAKPHLCDLLSIDQLRRFQSYYQSNYESKDSDFKYSGNPILKKLRELNSDEMKAILTKEQQSSMQKLYQTKLEKLPEYKKLLEMKKNLQELDTYIKYREKQAQSEKRKGLKGRLGELKTEYDSAEMKEALPDEKQRLSVRGVVHKKLKKEAGM